MNSKSIKTLEGNYFIEFNIDNENKEVEVKISEYDPDLEIFNSEAKVARVKTDRLIETLEWIKKEHNR